jgi:hypothetical protein
VLKSFVNSAEQEFNKVFMRLNENIYNYFEEILIKQNVEAELILPTEVKWILTSFGMPHGVMDFDFNLAVTRKSNHELMIGKIWEQCILLNNVSGKVYREDGCFLSKSLICFIE